MERSNRRQDHVAICGIEHQAEELAHMTLDGLKGHGTLKGEEQKTAVCTGGGGALPVRPDTNLLPPPLDPPAHTGKHLVRTAGLGARKFFFEPGKICNTLDSPPPLVYIQNAQNEMGNSKMAPQ